MSEVLIPFVNYLVVLDGDGDRLLAKYYDGRTKSEQIKNEAMLHKKTKAVTAKTDAEVLLLDNEVAVFRSGSECKFYIAGPVEENELILVSVLDVLFDTVSTLLRGQVDKKTMLDNLELVLLTIDEAIDHGHIMELDSTAVVNRVLMKNTETTSQQPGGGQAIGDLSITQALGMARDQFMRTIASNPRGDGY
mmetsp:Transcript_12705/g.12347  ORF Transcript_12705/g.12347 Transcript_12705/m.12347 type:complete len:192 (-) Transcript_12705:372-947(-)|eukprot:CAMPEP_0119035544 /NCGR_PEP_ID=MMETSP1177-20130426/2601_1 /TAXON_ID=2985 /ORGANISM="Ochromonas sp, Strain CCMP1899" /LENGTH=191 /DNA_ID=CAMNT_0006993937 /DNA_START=151 /DNA_END=726 /DNA_ORIENTATION=-